MGSNDVLHTFLVQLVFSLVVTIFSQGCVLRTGALFAVQDGSEERRLHFTQHDKFAVSGVESLDLRTNLADLGKQRLGIRIASPVTLWGTAPIGDVRPSTVYTVLATSPTHRLDAITLRSSMIVQGLSAMQNLLLGWLTLRRDLAQMRQAFVTLLRFAVGVSGLSA